MKIDHPFAPGLYDDISAADYHSDRFPPMPSMSSTLGRLMVGKSPRHAWTASQRLNPDYTSVSKKTFDIGKAAHRRVLGKGDAIEVIPDVYLSKDGSVSTKAAKEFVAEVRAAGAVPLKSEEFAGIVAMETALRVALRDQMPEPIDFDPAHSERVVFGVIDGIWCRAMVDNAPPDPKAPITDFKTCEVASLDACARAVSGYDYAFQASHYLQTWQAATGEKRRFRFVFQEKGEPYEVNVVELDDEGEWQWFTTADDKVRQARYLWRRSLETGVWPGYPRQTAIISAPRWYVDAWETRAKPSSQALDFARRAQSPEGFNG